MWFKDISTHSKRQVTKTAEGSSFSWLPSDPGRRSFPKERKTKGFGKNSGFRDNLTTASGRRRKGYAGEAHRKSI